MLDEIKRHLRDLIGANTWEELCREWLLRASANRSVAMLVDQVGSVWTRTAQVDVVGINSHVAHQRDHAQRQQQPGRQRNRLIRRPVTAGTV